MKVLIEIDDNDYADIMSDSERNLNHYERLIKKGVPLPKGHGRLIDADDLDLKRIDIILSGKVKDTVDALSKMGMLIITAPTVIEADEAESEDKE